MNENNENNCSKNFKKNFSYFVMYRTMLLSMLQIDLPFISNIIFILEDVHENRNVLLSGVS